MLSWMPWTDGPSRIPLPDGTMVEVEVMRDGVLRTEPLAEGRAEQLVGIVIPSDSADSAAVKIVSVTELSPPGQGWAAVYEAM